MFDLDGTFEFGYQSGVRGAVDIADCYCACSSGTREVCFSPYTDFPLVRLNIEERSQIVHELPERLRGASALATDGESFVFVGSRAERNTFYRWRPGGSPEAVGSAGGHVRTHGAGFLSTTEDSYRTLVLR